VLLTGLVGGAVEQFAKLLKPIPVLSVPEVSLAVNGTRCASDRVCRLHAVVPLRSYEERSLRDSCEPLVEQGRREQERLDGAEQLEIASLVAAVEHDDAAAVAYSTSASKVALECNKQAAGYVRVKLIAVHLARCLGKSQGKDMSVEPANEVDYLHREDEITAARELLRFEALGSLLFSLIASLNLASVELRLQTKVATVEISGFVPRNRDTPETKQRMMSMPWIAGLPDAVMPELVEVQDEHLPPHKTRKPTSRRALGALHEPEAENLSD
jgi:hypothetical protein